MAEQLQSAQAAMSPSQRKNQGLAPNLHIDSILQAVDQCHMQTTPLEGQRSSAWELSCERGVVHAQDIFAAIIDVLHPSLMCKM